MRTGRTAARDPHPAGFVSARDTLGWISSVNCSVAVSTCPAHDTAAELLQDFSPRGRGFDPRRYHLHRHRVHR